MKRVISLLLSLFVIGGSMMILTSCTDNKNDEEDIVIDDKTVYIGVYESLSGDDGDGGKKELLGIQYANELVSAVDINGESYNVQLIISDNESSVDKAPSAAQDIVSKGASIVLGSYDSSTSIAASDVFKKGGIPAIAMSCTDPMLTDNNTHYFRISCSDGLYGRMVAEYAEKNGIKKVYCLSNKDDEASLNVANSFINGLESVGIEYISEKIGNKESDFSKYMDNILISQADMFFAPIGDELGLEIIDQWSSYGSSIPVYVTDSFDCNAFIEKTKDKPVDLYVLSLYNSIKNSEFEKGFEKWIIDNKQNEKASVTSALGYDAYFVALAAIKSAASTDAAKITEALWSVNYDGISGNISFNETGNANINMIYLKRFNNDINNFEVVSEYSLYNE